MIRIICPPPLCVCFLQRRTQSMPSTAKVALWVFWLQGYNCVHFFGPTGSRVFVWFVVSDISWFVPDVWKFFCFITIFYLFVTLWIPPLPRDESVVSRDQRILSPVFDHRIRESFVICCFRRIMICPTCGGFRVRCSFPGVYTTPNNVFVRLRVNSEFESEKRSNSEWIVSVPKCTIHEARYASCDNSSLRPLISLSRVSMCSCKHTPAMEANKSAHRMKIWPSWSEWSKPLSIVNGTLNLTKTVFYTDT